MFSPRFTSYVLLVASLALFSVSAQNVPVKVPVMAPSNASSISSSILSFSIEQDTWTQWAGTTSPNTFFYNALDNLKQRTGEAPWLRIGADSEDRTDFNPNIEYSETTWSTPNAKTPYPEASTVVVGNGYYEIISHMPPGTKVVWGVNLRSYNLTAAVLEATSIRKAFDSPAVKSKNITLEFIEIGNEAGGYATTGHRDNATWNIAEYVKEWTQFAVNVSVAAGINSTSKTKFWGGAFAGSSHTTTGFSPQGLFANNIQNSTQGKLITTISQHHYSGSFCAGSGGLLQDLMTKSTIRGNLSRYAPDIPIVREHGLDYVFGETNSYACHGAPNVSNTAGAALWTLDYTLWATQLNITRMHFHMGVGYKYNLLQPVTLTRSILDATNLTTPLPPHVQAQYYGGLVATEAIGTSGETRIVELIIDDPRIAGYGFYEGGVLKRAVLINSQAYLVGRTTPRTSKNVVLTFEGTGTKPKTMTIKRLKIGHADDATGLTWGGQSFETSDARPSGNLFVTTADVNAGVSITETEAVLLTFT